MSATDISSMVRDYVWRYDLSRTLAEYVRQSDGFVVDKRRMTPEEINREMKKSTAESPPKKNSTAGGTTMKMSMEEKYAPLFGNEYGSLTFDGLDGQHPTSGAAFGKFTCACGAKIDKTMVSDVIAGRKRYCNGLSCPIAIADRAKAPSSNGRKKKAKSTRVVRSQPEETARQQPEAPPTFTGNGSSPHKEPLLDAAATMRQAAVLINHGAIGNAVDLLRQQAELIDERIYAPA